MAAAFATRSIARVFPAFLAFASSGVLTQLTAAPASAVTYATSFSYPVRAVNHNDQNTNPLGAGWIGYGLGAGSGAYCGHFGQDYYKSSGSSVDEPVYAAAN